MDLKNLSLKTRLLLTGVIALLILINLVWDHFHGGVPTHYLLHRQDLPGFSNWWGVLTVPLLTWYLLARIGQRMRNEERAAPIVYRFMGAFVFGVILSVLFLMGSDMPGYMMITAMALSLFIPLYRAEYLLGLVIGLTYTFGGVLPIIIGGVLMLIFSTAYLVIRKGVLYLFSKFRSAREPHQAEDE